VANKIKLQSSVSILVHGDGTSTSISLSLSKDPFPERIPGRIVDAVILSAPAVFSSVSFTANECILVFSSAFNGDTDPINLQLICDPS